MNRRAAWGRGGAAVGATKRSEDNFRSMEIAKKVREIAAKQNAAKCFVAAEEAEAGMKQMSEKFWEEGGEIYLSSPL